MPTPVSTSAATSTTATTLVFIMAAAYVDGVRPPAERPPAAAQAAGSGSGAQAQREPRPRCCAASCESASADAHRFRELLLRVATAEVGETAVNACDLAEAVGAVEAAGSGVLQVEPAVTGTSGPTRS